MEKKFPSNKHLTNEIFTWGVLFVCLFIPWFCFSDQILFRYINFHTQSGYLDITIVCIISLFISSLIVLLIRNSFKKSLNGSRELEENLKLQTMMLEQMDDVVWVLDLETMKFKYVSPSVKKIRGYTPEEILGQPLTHALTEESNSFVSSQLHVLVNAYENGDELARTRTQNIFQTCRDGSVIETEVQVSLVKNAAGKVSEMIGVTRDITEKKAIKERLEENEYWFNECQKVGQIGTYIFKLSENTWECSATLAEIFGINNSFKKNIEGWLSLVHPDEVGEIEKKLFEAIKEKSSFDCEYRIIRKNDQHGRWVHVRGKFVDEESSIEHKMIGTVQDITEHKRDTSLLHDSERKYKTIIETSLNGFFITDKAGYILEVNDAYCKMSGYSREKLLKMNLCDLEFNKEPNDVLDHLLKIAKYGSDKFETKHETEEGTIISLEASLTYDQQNGEIFYCFMNDLTDKNQMLQELVLAKDEAERSNRVKSEFLAQMSHEIRSPMNVTLSFTNYIKDELGDSLAPHLVESFAAVDTSTRRVIRTIDLILNMSEMQLGTYEPTWKSFDLIKEVFNNICSEYEFYAKQKGLGLVFNSSVQAAKIYGDSYSVTQIFVNLVDNAIKYSNAGAITINLFRDEQKNFRVTVQDTGIGMSEEFMAKLFEPFTQETQGYSRRFEGNGLGLALVKRYCDLNNADISVESEKGKGTKFTVVFHRLVKLNVAVE